MHLSCKCASEFAPEGGVGETHAKVDTEPFPEPGQFPVHRERRGGAQQR